jgi:hypothetical protein
VQAEERDVARHLAACWYYTATECNFDESDDDDAAPLAAGDGSEAAAAGGSGSLLANVFGGAAANAAGNGDDDEEEDEEEDMDYDAAADANAADDDDEGEEEEEEEAEEQEEKEKESKKRVSFGELPEKSKSAKTNEAAEDDGEAEEEEEEEEEDDEPIDIQFIREDILKSVDALAAFVPDPHTDPFYFRLMLKRMQARTTATAITLRTFSRSETHSFAQIPDDTARRWFPWGIPPTAKLAAAANQDADLPLRDYATKLFQFMNHPLPPKKTD